MHMQIVIAHIFLFFFVKESIGFLEGDWRGPQIPITSVEHSSIEIKLLRSNVENSSANISATYIHKAVFNKQPTKVFLCIPPIKKRIDV